MLARSASCRVITAGQPCLARSQPSFQATPKAARLTGSLLSPSSPPYPSLAPQDTTTLGQSHVIAGSIQRSPSLASRRSFADSSGLLDCRYAEHGAAVRVRIAAAAAGPGLLHVPAASALQGLGGTGPGARAGPGVQSVPAAGPASAAACSSRTGRAATSAAKGHTPAGPVDQRWEGASSRTAVPQ
jgi:hypothetical protein